MRVRLLGWLGRLVGWRFNSQVGPESRPPGSRAVAADASGRHRRYPGDGRRAGNGPTGPVSRGAQARQAPSAPLQPPAGLPRQQGARPPQSRNYASAQGSGRARIREAPAGSAPIGTVTGPQVVADQGTATGPGRPAGAARQPWYHVVGGPSAPARTAARRGQAATASKAGAVRRGAPAEAVTTAHAPSPALPFAEPHEHGHATADGRRNCGQLESILWRQWDAAATTPPPQVVAAIDRLAEFPRQLQEKLAAGLDGIYIGVGGVPDLDHMGALHDIPLPSGKATWDACAGAYGDRKIVVGTRPSPTPDVMCHEVGHALDDLDSPPGKWQSDSAEFRLIYEQCQPFIASDFHRQRGGLGRKEFFADSFAAIASAQRPALVDMLRGNTRIALRVMLYFNRRYGI